VSAEVSEPTDGQDERQCVRCRELFPVYSGKGARLAWSNQWVCERCVVQMFNELEPRGVVQRCACHWGHPLVCEAMSRGQSVVETLNGEGVERQWQKAAA
jgi:hypothetical protein